LISKGGRSQGGQRSAAQGDSQADAAFAFFFTDFFFFCREGERERGEEQRERAERID
jgi:hypothetical protein